MISMSLSETARVLNGHLLGSDANFSSVSTDSRSLKHGDLFVALSGPNFDGHDYIGKAQAAGAVGALVQNEIDNGLSCVRVDDSLKGLGELASVWRGKSNARVAAVTGSNGKTTVKEMLAAILMQKGSVLATKGNLNNDIGMPLTLLRLQDEPFAVIEMGANHAGEISYLTQIAKPDVAVITNAGRAHLEGFGSVEGVARAKGEIVEGLDDRGTFVVNADDKYFGLWKELAGSRAVRSFGLDRQADVSTKESELRTELRSDGFYNCFPVTAPEGEFEVQLALPGIHNCRNALAAIAVAGVLGASIEDMQRGLANIKPVAGRLCPKVGINDVLVIDDSYNANPDSVSAAIDVLAAGGKGTGSRYLILGELAELGEGVEQIYRQLGDVARASGIERLYAVGAAGDAADSFGDGGRGFDNKEKLIAALNDELASGDRVLIKGSRSAAMETVVAAICDREGN